MQQVALFPLSPAELTQKAKEQAALELEYARLATEKGVTARSYTKRLKQLRQQIQRLATEVDRKHAERAATDEEAPWQGALDRIHERTGAPLDDGEP
jgi:hypothetical protein